MLGKRKSQRELFDVGNVYPLALPAGSFHAQLAAAAPTLFRDADFSACYHATRGRFGVPPAQLALLTLLQHEAGVSDAEAVDRSAYDLRWAAVLGRSAGEPLCVKSTFQLFRGHLILHNDVRKIFEKSIQTAKDKGLLKSGPLRVALDTKPILGRGAVEDTYNLLATGIQRLGAALAHAAGPAPADWARCHDLGRYWAGSIKGGADLDWSNDTAQAAFLTEIVTDARRLLRLTEAVLPGYAEPTQQTVRAAAELLAQLLRQDIVETGAAAGSPRVELRDGPAPDRQPSATDPDQRHGRKSASKRFTGHKASATVDLESQIILDVEVLAGNAADATDALAQVARAEQAAGQAITEVLGDCAYGSGATRQAFADEGRALVAKVPAETARAGCFPKSHFQIDFVVWTVTCPASQTTAHYTPDAQGGKLFHFGAVCAACPLRAQCTTAKGGREVRVHAQEELLREARAYQQTPAGREKLRKRVVIEHRLARLGQLGIGQARYCGRAKVRFQLLLAATLANLRWTWNWSAIQAAAGTIDRARPAETSGGPAGGVFRRSRRRSGSRGSVPGWCGGVAAGPTYA